MYGTAAKFSIIAHWLLVPGEYVSNPRGRKNFLFHFWVVMSWGNIAWKCQLQIFEVFEEFLIFKNLMFWCCDDEEYVHVRGLK